MVRLSIKSSVDDLQVELGRALGGGEGLDLLVDLLDLLRELLASVFVGTLILWRTLSTVESIALVAGLVA